jgi:hypothetical protein
VREQQTFNEWTRHLDGRPGPLGLFGHAFLAIDVMTAFTSMITLGMFEKYPRMKCAVLEAGATWIGAWLDRLDYKGEVTESLTPIKLKPSEYFYRQCVVSADPDETMIAPVVNHLAPTILSGRPITRISMPRSVWSKRCGNVWLRCHLPTNEKS